MKTSFVRQLGLTETQVEQIIMTAQELFMADAPLSEKALSLERSNLPPRVVLTIAMILGDMVASQRRNEENLHKEILENATPISEKYPTN